MASRNKNSSKLKSLNWILLLAIGLLVISIILYFLFIFGLDDNEKANWGTFGDFLGGTLNPIFALFSLFAIIYTIKIQTEELELSRQELAETKEELKESRIAQQEQSDSLKLQNNATKLQIFENTFFQLLNIFNILKSRIRVTTKISFKDTNKEQCVINNSLELKISGIKEGHFNGAECMEVYLSLLKKGYSNDYDSFNKDFEKYTSAYFGHLYQIIKFIDESNIKDKQRYINILRAQFMKDELEFLFYHCLGKLGKRKFKQLLEKYEFFEHIVHHYGIEKPLLEYEIKAFGKNEVIIKKYNEMKER